MSSGLTPITLRQFTSLEDLRAGADAWDDLWRRSEGALPRAKAYLVALWVETFAGAGDFLALAVEQEGRLLAALPLMSRKHKVVFKIGCMTSTPAATGGDFLLDPACHVDAVLDLLTSALNRLPFAVLFFEGIAFNEPRWKALLGAMKRGGSSVDVSEQHRIGRVEVAGEWADYEASLSGNHRRNRRKQTKRLEECGGADLEVHSEVSGPELIALLRRGFEVEDRSWKGRSGSSILKTGGLFQFFCKEAAFLADQGLLELVFLTHRGRPIAFIYGWQSRGIHYTPKVGYDESYREFGPGQQLMMRFLRYLHEKEQPQTLDFHGPLEHWTESWATDTYSVGRIVATTQHPLSRTLFNLNFRVKPRIKYFQDGGTRQVAAVMGAIHARAWM